MSFHLFYNYSLNDDDANCLNFLLHDYLKSRPTSKFRCRTIKDFLYYLLLGSLEENEVLCLIVEAIYYLPRRDILYECNIAYNHYDEIYFGKYINIKRILIFKLFNAFDEVAFKSFTTKFVDISGNGDSDIDLFNSLELLFKQWSNDDEMNKAFTYLQKYYSTSDIPNIISKYTRCDIRRHDEIKIPSIAENSDIIVTLEKGDQSDEPKFLVNSELGPETIDYNAKDSYPYPEDDSIKSLCLIFNIYKYTNRPRRGSEFDVEKIRSTFKALYFTTQVYENNTKAEMFQIIELYSKLEKEKAGSMFVCFLLAHGDKDSIFDINEELVSIRELSMKFSAKNCQAYREKPKIFFIQACQGEKYQQASLELKETSQTFTTPEVEHDGLRRSQITEYKQYSFVPEEADFIFGMSTVSNHVAFRNIKKGSWYITHLCKKIDNMAAQSHLTDILISVNSSVSKKKYGKTYCQQPIFCTTATKKCHLRKPVAN